MAALCVCPPAILATSVATVPSVKRAVHSVTRPAPAKHKLARAAKKPIQTASAKSAPCDATPAIRTSAILPYAITLPELNTADAGTGNIPGSPLSTGGRSFGGGGPVFFGGGGGFPGGGGGGGIGSTTPGNPVVETPTTPETPTDPATPTDPSTPTTPTDPGTPTTPTDPGTPTTPTDPGTPTTPTDPGTPTTPTDPGTPTTPTDPGTPVTPTGPETPVIPTDPGTPVIPTDPGTPMDPTAPVPEPGTWLLMISGFGLVGIGIRWRRARKVAALGTDTSAAVATTALVAAPSRSRRRRHMKKAGGFSTIAGWLGLSEVATGSASMATIAAKTMMCVCPTVAIVGTTMAVPPVRSAVFKATAVPTPAPKYALTVVKPPCDPSIRSADADPRIIDATDASPKMQTALLASTLAGGR